MYKKKSPEEIKDKKESIAKETAQIFIKALEEGNAPWQKGWNPAIDRRDHNMFTMKNDKNNTYKGYNELKLSLVRLYHLKTDDTRWFTFPELIKYNSEVKDEKDRVFIKKGESMTPISFYSPIYYDENGKRLDPSKMSSKELKEKTKRTTMVLKNYFIANASQTQRFMYDENGNKLLDKNGIQKTETGFPFELSKEQIEKAEKEFKPDFPIIKIIENTGATIINDTNDEAFFDPKKDEIHLPQKERFTDSQEYYQTLAHELIHWAGDKKRLNRPELLGYGLSKEIRAKEELVAEIGCYLLCKDAQFMYKPSENNKAYIKSWCNHINEKNDAIEEACRKAQKSVNYIMDFTLKQNKKADNLEIVITPEKEKGRGIR